MQGQDGELERMRIYVTMETVSATIDMSRKDRVALGSQRESLSVNPLLVQV